MWAKIRLRENKNVRIDRIMKVGMFKQTFYKEAVPLLPEYFMEMRIMYGWETLSYLVL